MKDLPRLALVSVILATGFIAALPFRRNHDAAPDRIGIASPEDLVLRRDVGLQINPVDLSDQEGSKDARSPAPNEARSGNARPAVIRSPGVNPGRLRPVPTKVPKLSRKYEPFPQPRDDSNRIVSAPNQDDSPTQTPAVEESITAERHLKPDLVDRPDSPSSRDSPLSRHRIIDGDNLQDLAGRYLGDRGRYLELYEQNRDVLDSPDLLPIGTEIRIPQPGRRR